MKKTTCLPPKQILFVIGFLCIINVFAQSPQAFKYQAIARNSLGLGLVNQNVGFKVSLLQGSATGTTVYSEEHNLNTNSFGLVTLEIGNGNNPVGVFVNINWALGPYFIKIEFDANGGTVYADMGTTQLLSVPYALFAASGTQGPQGLQGTPGTNGQNGISVIWLGTFTSNPVNPITNNAYYNSTDKKSYIYDGTGWQIIAQDGNQGLQGTPGTNGQNGISMVWLGTFTSHPLNPITNNAYYNSTDKKSYIFDGLGWQIIAQDGMQGLQGLPGIAGTYIAGAGINISNDTISTKAGGINGNLQFNNNGIFGGNNALFWDNNNLRLGIGTSLPTSTLHINGTLRISDDTEGAGKILTSDANGYASWQVSSNGSITGTQNRIAKFTSSTSLGNSLFYESGNYIGLGTTTPFGKLVIQGDSLSADSVPLFEVKDKSGNTVFVVWPTGAHFYIDSSSVAKTANRGSFAVSGKSQTKNFVNEFFSVNSDSIKASKSLYIPRLTTIERDNLGFTPSEALIIFNTTDECMQIFKNSVWSNIWCFNCAPAIIVQPIDKTICSGSNTNFNVSLTGTNLVYQWQESIDGGTTWNDVLNVGTYSGATTYTLALSNVLVGFDGYKYRCNITANCPPEVTTSVVTLNVGSTPPTITTQPTSQPLTDADTANFNVSSPGFGVSYQWQQSPDGTTWSDITSSGTSPVFGGFTAAILNLSSVPSIYNNYKFRCVVSNLCGASATSNPATLTISIPTLSTTVASGIQSTLAASGGNVTSNGGAAVTARGVCWSTLQNPTISDSYTTDGIGTGSFSSSITGLTLGITYYVRAYATNDIGIAYGNEISFITVLSVGQNYQGGIIAYILQPTDLGYIAGQTHGLIATPSDQSTGIQWYNGSYTITGATAIAIGTGSANTNTIIANQGAGNYAAQLCADLVLGGYSDWYLPSKDELNVLYQNKAAIGSFVNTSYWSSSEFSNVNTRKQNFLNGSQINSDKLNAYYVRAIRAF